MLNFKTVQIAIPQYEIKNEKKMLISKTVVVWQIETDVQGSDNKMYVLRKDSDFYFLRKCLVELYPYIMVPALPKRKESTNNDHLEKLQKIFNRFLSAVVKSEVLKTCQLVVAFLMQDQKKDWSNVK